MFIFFYILIGLVVVQRIMELLLAKKNEKWMLQDGAYEVGANHYKLIVLMHIFFFISLIVEVHFYKREFVSWGYMFLVLFIIAQIMRVWALYSLGRFWNTKIIVLPGAPVIQKGPYKYMRHPNYVVVAMELLALPLLFQAYITAIIFTLLNIALMSIRIPLEEKALREATNYEEEFNHKSRFYP